MTTTRSFPRVGVRPADLVMVLLVRDDDRSGPMPTVRLSQVAQAAHRLVACGVPAVKLFVSTSTRDVFGQGGVAPDSLMARAIAEVKNAQPDLTVMTETCLCSYTPTGDCHITNLKNRPDIPGTIDALAEQAVAQAEAGADVVGSSGR